MKKVIILGGGIAGLSAASFFAEQGFTPEIIEASPKLGGRAYSFCDQYSGYTFDNGQHLMMGCYKETLHFFELIGAAKHLYIQDNLNIRFLKKGYKEYRLKASKAPYPINLISALLNYDALDFYDKLSLIRIFLKLPLYSSKDFSRFTVKEWLTNEGASENSVKSFWEILCVGTLNADVKTASADIFVKVLKEVFLKGKKSSLLVLPRYGLSETYCTPAEKFILNHGGHISKGETVLKIGIKKGKVNIIKTNEREIIDFHYVISALPYYSLKKILPVIREIPFRYSPILSAQVVLKNKKLENSFWGLIDSPIHWIFNKGTHLSIVISSAGEFMNLDNNKITGIILRELNTFLNIEPDEVLSCRVIKEKRATFIPDNKIKDKRPPVSTSLENFFIVGDWVQTELPATLESAVSSSRMAVNLIGHL